MNVFFRIKKSTISLLVALALLSLKLANAQFLFDGGPNFFPLFNSYIPGYFGWAPPEYVFTSYSLGGFKFQGQEDELAKELQMMQGGGGGGGAPGGMGGGGGGMGGGPGGGGDGMGGGGFGAGGMDGGAGGYDGASLDGAPMKE